MYTGIVQGLESIVNIKQGDGYTTLFVSNNHGFFNDVFVGASVAINGTCLTTTQINLTENYVCFDVASISNQLTTLSSLRIGDEVNVERSSKIGMENGGHNLYGHVEGKAIIKNVVQMGETLHLDIEIPDGNIKYFFLKGFIGLNGCSLTVNRVNRETNEISVDLIPETLRLTTWKYVKTGDFVNYEIDQTTRTLVDTLENIHRR